MSEHSNKKGAIVIISGPSGVGKSTICREVVKQLSDVRLSVSVTTRPRGESEVDGRDYWFISKEQFRQHIDKGMLLEYAEVFGNFYGTPKEEVGRALEAAETIILEIDFQGARHVKQIYPDAVMIFILPPTQDELAERLNGRGRDEREIVEKRLQEAGSEIAAARQYYEHMVINNDLEQAVKEVTQIIQKARGDANDR
ncbi:MAG: guanylate kinase [Planctomycetota bacterium]